MSKNKKIKKFLKLGLEKIVSNKSNLCTGFRFSKTLVFSIIVFVLYCGNAEQKKSSFKRFNTKEVIGSWKIIPSYDAKIIFDKDERSFLLKENQKIEIFALEDVRGLRLQYRLEDDSPFAYFLFTEKTKDIWGGVLDDKVVRIKREGQTPESILE